MTRRCELTGKLPMSGQLRSHAENKTKRTFRPNLCEVTLISDALQRKLRLRISAHALKTVEKRGGLDAFLHEGQGRGAVRPLPEAQARSQEGAERAGRSLTVKGLTSLSSRSMRTSVRSAPHTKLVLRLAWS